MSDTKSAYSNVASIAGASTQTEVIPLKSAINACIVIQNTGANPITSVTVSKSPLGAIFGPDSALGTAIGSIPAATTILIELSQIAFTSLKLVLAAGAAAPTSYSIEACGKGN